MSRGREKGPSPALPNDKEEGDSGIDANSQGSCSSSDVKGQDISKNKKKKKSTSPISNAPSAQPSPVDKKPADKIETLKTIIKVDPKLPVKAENKSSGNLAPSSSDVKLNLKQEKENVAPAYIAVSDAKSVKDKIIKNTVDCVSSMLTENKVEKREKYVYLNKYCIDLNGYFSYNEYIFLGKWKMTLSAAQALT